jgi:restriction endonuclease Mrr
MEGLEIINPYLATTRQGMKRVFVEKAQEFLNGSKLSRKQRRELARAGAKELMGRVEKHADV